MSQMRGHPASGSLEGLYGPRSVAWQINREAMLLLGAGPRALLMQIAHPLIAEGVDQHSTFRDDPWSRLRDTTRSYLTIVFGSSDEARSEIRRLNGLHRTIRGPVNNAVARHATGAARYRARDPRLSLWVHATLVDSVLVAYQAWIAPLPPDLRQRAYEETRPIGLALGVPDGLLPATFEAFDEYLAEMLAPDGPIVVTPTARELAQTILHPPLAPILTTLGRPRRGLGGAAEEAVRATLRAIPAPVYDWTLWPAIRLLPSRLLVDFGIAWGPRNTLVSDWLVAGFRFWRPVLPPSFRTMPAALRADRRIARGAAAVAESAP